MSARLNVSSGRFMEEILEKIQLRSLEWTGHGQFEWARKDEKLNGVKGCYAVRTLESILT